MALQDLVKGFIPQDTTTRTSGSSFISAIGGAPKTNWAQPNQVKSQDLMTPVSAADLNKTIPQVPQPPMETPAASRLSTSVGAVTLPVTTAPAVDPTAAAEGLKTPSAAETTNPRQTVLDRMKELIGIQSDQGERNVNILNRSGVDERAQAVNDIDNEIKAKELSYRREEERIRANAEGKFGTGVNVDLANLELKKNQELADLAIIKSAKLGDYNTAYQIAQDKIAAESEPIQQELDSLKELYGLYQNDLSESEKLLVQEEINVRQSALELENQMKLASYREALSAASGGGAVGSDGRPLTAGQKTKLDAANIVRSQLQNYRDLVDKYVSEDGTLLFGENAADLQAARSLLEFQLAQAVGTGALQAADRAVIIEALPDPTKASGFIGRYLRGGKGGLLKAIDRASSTFDDTVDLIETGGSSGEVSDPDTGQAVSKASGEIGFKPL